MSKSIDIGKLKYTILDSNNELDGVKHLSNGANKKLKELEKAKYKAYIDWRAFYETLPNSDFSKAITMPESKEEIQKLWDMVDELDLKFKHAEHEFEKEKVRVNDLKVKKKMLSELKMKVLETIRNNMNNK